MPLTHAELRQAIGHAIGRGAGLGEGERFAIAELQKRGFHDEGQ